jgi:hypothetical protein
VRNSHAASTPLFMFQRPSMPGGKKGLTTGA